MCDVKKDDIDVLAAELAMSAMVEIVARPAKVDGGEAVRWDIEDFVPVLSGKEDYGPLIRCIGGHLVPPTQGVMLGKIVRGSREYVHEVFGNEEQWLKPYIDYDDPVGHDTEAAMLAVKWPTYEACLAEIRKIFDIRTTIHGFEACGWSMKKNKWVNSFHFIVVGAGVYKCGADMIRAGIIPKIEGIDHAPYREVGARQTMRMPGMSKLGENRPFRRVVRQKDVLSSLDIWEMDEGLRRLTFMSGLIQVAGDEKHIEMCRPEECMLEEGEVAIGRNGLPLGSDIDIKTVAQVEELVKAAGWFDQVARDYKLYFEEMCALANTAVQYGLDFEEMRDLAQRVAATCPNNDPRNVNLILNTSRFRRPDSRRKLIAHIRVEAGAKNEGAYLKWLASVKREPGEDTKTEAGAVARVPYLFIDHSSLAGKHIEQWTANMWMHDALIMVMNGGDSYFLTRGNKVCEITNRPFEIWRNIKTDKLMSTLDMSVFIKNPDWVTDPNPNTVAKTLEKMEALGIKEFNYTTFGPSHKETKGFVADYVYKRKVKWVDYEDFIPFLARRIPDPDIKRAVTNKLVFNKFRGFPIEEEIYQPEGPKFLGSAWHMHLLNGICHGDAHEWKHLEMTIAHMIQMPYKLSGVAHVFQGKQGTGKSFLHKFMLGLLGAAHTMLITDMTIYAQKFNEDQGSAILKVFEEVRGKGDQFINNDRLKADITKPVIRVEIKNGAILSLRHASRYWMLTNHRDTLHIEADDRRYVYHSVSAEHANDKVYFAPIVAEIESREYLRAAFEHFAELPVDEMFVMTAITTTYKNEQKIDSMPLPFRFLQDVIELDLLATADLLRRDGDKVAGTLIHELYDAWCSKNHCPQGSSKYLMKAFGQLGLVQKTMKIQGTGMKGIVINSLDLRDRFREHHKMPNFDWDV